MRTISIILICLSTLGFVLAAIASLMDSSIAGVTAEGFSQGCTNIALIAIALTVCLKGGSKE
jgi:NADH:ubiquinone oxidoreductase subunit 4 (subunit M)